MIPGHGGIMDRFDCQFLMATFVNVYISSFIRTASPAKLLAQVSDFVVIFSKLTGIVLGIHCIWVHCTLHIAKFLHLIGYVS